MDKENLTTTFAPVEHAAVVDLSSIIKDAYLCCKDKLTENNEYTQYQISWKIIDQIQKLAETCDYIRMTIIFDPEVDIFGQYMGHDKRFISFPWNFIMSKLRALKNVNVLEKTQVATIEEMSALKKTSSNSMKLTKNMTIFEAISVFVKLNSNSNKKMDIFSSDNSFFKLISPLVRVNLLNLETGNYVICDSNNYVVS